MSGPLIAAIASLLLRLAVQSRGTGSPGDPQNGLVGGWGAFVWFVLVPVGGLLTLLSLTGQIYLLPLVAPILVLTFAWPIARSVLVPRGLTKAAYWLTYTSDFTFRLDRSGGAALAAAWALALRDEADDEAAEWIAARLARTETLRGAGIVATGLLLSARGDLDGARGVLESVRAIDERACPPAARRIAVGWLAADAAVRGEWARAAELGRTLGDGGREAWLLSGVASALQLEPEAPTPFGLWLRWALAPRRGATFPIVERALQALDGAFLSLDDEPPLRPAPHVEGDAWTTALALHASVLMRPRAAITGDDVRAVGQAWDAVLGDRATERMLLERALVIGAPGAAAALARMKEAIEGDLAAVVEASGLRLAELDGRGDLAGRVRVRLRDRLLEEVEAASEAMRRRVEERRELPPIDEWREWTAIRVAYERGVASAGDDFRRLAFLKVHGDACSLAVWLYNEREQRPLGNAIFKWLLAEAEATDDARAIALQTKNVACGV